MASHTSVSDIVSHLQKVAEDPSKIPLDVKLLQRFRDEITLKGIDNQSRTRLLSQLSTLIPKLDPRLGQDPTLLAQIVEELIQPSSFTFSDAQSIEPRVDYVAGLQPGATPINRVVLKLLEKASYSAGDAGIVAGHPDLVRALITLWLCAEDATIAQKCLYVLVKLLNARFATPEEGRPPPMEAYRPGPSYASSLDQGLMWRRLVNDKDVYGLIFAICSPKGKDPFHMTERQKTTAQGRLLDFLLIYADHPMVCHSQIAQLESEYNTVNGLLEFGALHMVDAENDMLMHMTLIFFYTKYVQAEFPDEDSIVWPSYSDIGDRSYLDSRLSFLESHGVHQHNVQHYLSPSLRDPSDSFLHAAYSKYFAAYLRSHQRHFLGDKAVIQQTLSHLSSSLGAVSSHQWGNNRAPADDLHIISSLPTLALVPVAGSSAIILEIPHKPFNSHAINTLSTIFHGPLQPPYPPDRAIYDNDYAAARVLYYLYYHEHQNLWRNVVQAATSGVVLEEIALAAIRFIRSLASAEWRPLSSTRDASTNSSGSLLPTEDELICKCPTALATSSNGRRYMPATGLQVLFASPVIEIVLPYLCSPPTAKSNPTHTGYNIAVAKHDLLLYLDSLLQKLVGDSTGPAAGQNLEMARVAHEAIRRVIRMGPFGSGVQPGGEIATLEM
ncbi:hypothetical protein MMC25_001661 [Agyrium rufum]|nr:hypothetical protein [Agyrium rufum]